MDRASLLILLLAALIACAGCTPIHPWEKGDLAKWHMALDPIPLESKFIQHVYDSREGCSGGYGIGGGGCGCN